MTMLGKRWHRVLSTVGLWLGLEVQRWPNIAPTLTFCHWQSDRYLVGIHTLAQRWANVHWWRVLTWLDCVGYITLGQHWTNVCLPLWFWITVGWKYYVGPTLGQCTPVHVLTWLDCVGCITLGQHWTNVCLPLWFWITVC